MKDLNFEKALDELEGIVEKMERGDLSLNESLELFERGVKLARYLRGEIDSAEKKIELLLQDEKGERKTQPFEVSVEESPSEDEENDPPQGENNDLPF